MKRPAITKEDFLQTYQQLLQIDSTSAHWATKPEMLTRFVEALRVTITTTETLTTIGPVAHRAWKALGGTGKVSLKMLRSLPLNNDAVTEEE